MIRVILGKESCTNWYQPLYCYEHFNVSRFCAILYNYSEPCSPM